MSHYGEYCNAHFGEFSSLFCMALFPYFYGLKREYIERFLKTWWSFIFNNKVSAGACVQGGPFADSKHWCGSGSLFSLWWGSWNGSCSSTKWCKAATTSIYRTSTALFRAPLLYCERPRLSIGYSSIFEPPQLLNFEFDVQPDPYQALYFDSDPDPASHMMRIRIRNTAEKYS